MSKFQQFIQKFIYFLRINIRPNSNVTDRTINIITVSFILKNMYNTVIRVGLIILDNNLFLNLKHL